MAGPSLRGGDGGKPSRPGLYLPYSMPAEELALLLEAHAARPAPPPPPPPPGRLRRWLLAAFLLGLGAAGCALDRSLGFRSGTFSSFIPIGWLGAALVFAAGRLPRPGSSWSGAARAGCASLFICGGPLGVAAFLYATDANFSTSTGLGTMGAVAVAAFGLWLDRRRGPAAPPEPPRDLIKGCADIVAALADDAMPGKPAAGWLDLTGPEQPEKLVRTATAANGAAIKLYRDEWWRLRLTLRDGNQLRLAGVVRRKARGQYWKQGRSRRKLKAGRTVDLATIEARLLVNPEVWRAKPADGAMLKLPGLALSPVQVADGSVSVAGEPKAASRLEPREVLAMLALLYRQLEPVAPGA